MMVNQYYYLISGLPDITLDDQKKQIEPYDFKQGIFGDIPSPDKELLQIFYYKFDNANVLNLLQKKEAQWNRLGIFSQEEVNEEISRIKDEGTSIKSTFPFYLQQFIFLFINDQLENGTVSSENQLALAYFEFAIDSGNSFVSAYYQFEKILLNFLTAFNARKYKMAYQNEILGHDEISEQIRKSSAKDFNISGEFEWTNMLLQVSEMDNVVEKEMRVDAIRWAYIEEAVFFNYFSIERIFAYILKLNMVDRWLSISNEAGQASFQKILRDLQSGYQLPQEYMKK